MGKITVRENFRVEIEPRSLGDYGFASISDYAIEPDEEKRHMEYEKICDAIVGDVKRHVDSVGHVSVISDSKEICKLCRGDWDLFEDGEPSCCEAAQDEWKASK